jgi:hypothetical protein
VWFKSDGLGAVAGGNIRGVDYAATGVWARSADDVFVVLHAPVTGAPGTGVLTRVAHFDGKAWTREEPPVGTYSLDLWASPGGDLWAAGVGTDAAPVLLRRVGGTWQRAAAPTGVSVDYLTMTGVDDEHIFIVGVTSMRLSTGQLKAWRKCGDGFAEIPTDAGTVGVVRLFALDATHIFAFGGAVEANRGIFAVLKMFDGKSLTDVAYPVPLTDIHGMAGTTIDDLYVVGNDRKSDGEMRVYHVTEGLRTWTRVSTPPALYFARVAPPVHGAVFAIGSERPDLYTPAPPSSGRLVRIEGSALSTEPTDPTAGWPQAITSDPAAGDLHVVLGDDGGVRHHRRHCE